MFEAFRRISFTVATFSRTPLFHLCACMSHPAGAEAGIWSEVGAVLGLLSQAFATSGLCIAPLSGFGALTPNRFLIC